MTAAYCAAETWDVGCGCDFAYLVVLFALRGTQGLVKLGVMFFFFKGRFGYWTCFLIRV